MADDHPNDEAYRAEVVKIAGRFERFLEEAYGGNQSVAAKKLGISQPAISRVVSGEQLPSGKLLLAVSKKSNFNVDWLYSGRGDMVLPEEASGLEARSVGTPVVNQPLPGSPDAHPDLLSGDQVLGCGFPLRPGQYWLRVQRGEPITLAEGQNVGEGDLILLDTDRARFPEPERIIEELWVVRFVERGVPQCRLAEVSYVAEGRLEADSFDLAVKANKEIVLRELPGGKYVGRAKPGKLKPRRAPRHTRFPRVVRAEDLIARKVVVLSR